MSLPTARRALVAAAMAGAAALAVALAPAANAAGLTVSYDVVGSTKVASTNSTITLGPSVLTSTVAPDGTLTGGISLPSTNTSFNALGLLPTTATVTFVPAAPLTGKMVSNPTPTISATASYYVKLSNVKLLGVPAFVGSNCQTAQPVTMTVSGPFSVTKGGTVGGTYSIGNFSRCGLTTTMINLLIPGSGNSVSLTLSNGRLGAS